MVKATQVCWLMRAGLQVHRWHLLTVAPGDLFHTGTDPTQEGSSPPKASTSKTVTWRLDSVVRT